MPGIFRDPRVDMYFIRTWDSTEEHCAKVATYRSDYIFKLKVQKTDAIKQMKDLLTGTVMSKFVSPEARRAYRAAVSKCIEILKNT